MKSFKQRSILVGLLIFVFILAITPFAFAWGVSRQGGTWPQNWPAPLEQFRERAETIHYIAGAYTLYYIIEFKTREEFEGVWPSILKLLSKGASIQLKTPDEPKIDPKDPKCVYDKPQVWIVCPLENDGKYEEQPDGTYRHIGLWTTDLNLTPESPLPDYAAKLKLTDKWVDWNEGKEVPWAEKDNFRDTERPHKARVDLVLYVDGNVIDLSRIKLPKDAEIKDNRKLGPNEPSLSRSAR